MLRRIRETSAAPIGVVGDERRWKKLVLKGRQATLTLNSMERERPGDEISKLVLSTRSFLSRIGGDHPKKEAVLKAVASCSIAVGVVAEPALDESEGHMACVLDVARSLQGMIFNGRAMLDADGAPLLGAEES